MGNNRMTLLDDFTKACTDGELTKVETMIRKDSNIVNLQHSNGNTGLIFATWKDNSSIVEKILSTPCVDISLTGTATKARGGFTAIHFACLCNSPKSLQLILQHPTCTSGIARKNDSEGKTAEMLAIENECMQCVELFKQFNSISILQQLMNNASITENQQHSLVSVFFDTRPVASLTLDEVFAETESLTNVEKEKDDIMEKKKEECNKKLQMLEATHEKEKQRLVKEYNDQLVKHQATFKKELDDLENIFSQGMARKQELQERLQRCLGPSLNLKNGASNISSAIPDCYVCFEKCWPSVKLMNCTRGHLVCEGCYHRMVAKVCGKCRNPITGRATDAEEMIRKILGVE